MHHRATRPRQVDSAVQSAFAAAGFDDHVVPARWRDGADALTSLVLMRMARFYGDLCCNGLLR